MVAIFACCPLQWEAIKDFLNLIGITELVILIYINMYKAIIYTKSLNIQCAKEYGAKIL